MRIKITTHSQQAEEDRAFWRSKTPEERLDAVELLRLEAGKFLYEYPARLQRVIRVDLLNEIDGVDFLEAKSKCVRGIYGDVSVTFIGKQDLLTNKRSTKRTKDKADVEEIERQ